MANSRTIPLLASAARTASGTAVIKDFDALTGASFFLDVTAAATEVDDTLNVYLQRSPDMGTTWDDFVSFTQVLGNGGAKSFVATWSSFVTPERELGAEQDAALAAGSVLQGGVLADQIRIKWVIVDAGADNASFTFSATMQIQE